MEFYSKALEAIEKYDAAACLGEVVENPGYAAGYPAAFVPTVFASHPLYPAKTYLDAALILSSGKP